MAGEEMTNVIKVLEAMPDTTGMSVEEIRKTWDELPKAFPVPGDVSVEEVDAGGVPGEWVKTPSARDDAALLYLHGGAYVFGSPVALRHVTAAMSEACNAVVLSLGYRLAPENPFPAAVDDAVAGYRWLIGQGFRPERTAIGGESAGGGLTLATLLALRDAGDTLPAAGICFSAWTDLSCSLESFTAKADVDPMLDPDDLSATAALYYADEDPKNPLISPVFADLGGLPPLLLLAGTDEILMDDSVELDKRARLAGVDSTLEVWEGMIHAWHIFHPMLGEGKKAITRAGEYFKAIVE